jgi:hypothetical protein
MQSVLDSRGDRTTAHGRCNTPIHFAISRRRHSNRSNCANRADATRVTRIANVRPISPTSRLNQEARGSMRTLRLPLSAVHSPIAPFSPLRELRCARRDSCIPQEVFSPPHYWRLLNSSGPTRWASYTRQREASSIWRDVATVKQFFVMFVIPLKTSKKRGFGPIVAPAFVVVLEQAVGRRSSRPCAIYFCGRCTDANLLLSFCTSAKSSGSHQIP